MSPQLNHHNIQVPNQLHYLRINLRANRAYFRVSNHLHFRVLNQVLSHLDSRVHFRASNLLPYLLVVPVISLLPNLQYIRLLSLRVSLLELHRCNRVLIPANNQVLFQVVNQQDSLQLCLVASLQVNLHISHLINQVVRRLINLL